MRALYIFLGSVFLAIGLVGLIVPLLPTTPFLLLTAFFYSRGSERLHAWLLNHRVLGPPLREWNRYGVIRPRAKFFALLFLVLSLGYALCFRPFAIGLKLLAGAVGIGAAFFIFTRPSRPPGAKSEQTIP